MLIGQWEQRFKDIIVTIFKKQIIQKFARCNCRYYFRVQSCADWPTELLFLPSLIAYLD